MRVLRSLTLVLALSLCATSCHKNLTPATPKAAAAIKADDVVIRLNELQAAVIQYCGPGPECQAGSLPTATARDIVKGLIDIRTVLRSAPEGWRATVKASWAQVRPKFAGITNPAIVSAIALVSVAVEGL